MGCGDAGEEESWDKITMAYNPNLNMSNALGAVSFAPGDCKPYGHLTPAFHAPSAMNSDIEIIVYSGLSSSWIMNSETLITYFPQATMGMVMCELLRQGKTIYFYGDVNTVTELVTNTDWNYF
jgi:hypothetical protein